VDQSFGCELVSSGFWPDLGNLISSQEQWLTRLILLLSAEGLLFCFDIFAVLVSIPDSSPGDVIN